MNGGGPRLTPAELEMWRRRVVLATVLGPPLARTPRRPPPRLRPPPAPQPEKQA